ncbi:DUF6113 family protein [Streptomyces sp. WMMC940]|uniref:DUF6113 family protein n=1 Tax=Streptomyces sp. WMMC940 TaxID=3015153 RepID=UPI0022B62C71|nr:DUF6113 family protein [Streptomyces sp. WMMC940]MCZ7458163.1 DUF6113 family protein [Streptomyces sp. WMMC940]
MSGSGTRPARPSKAVRVAAYIGLAVLGVAVGTAGSLVQAAWFPLGLLLALLGAAALFYGGLRATGTQLGVVAPAAGWVAAVLLLSAGRPEGDGVFAGGLGEIVFLLGGTVLAVMCATMTRLPQPSGPSGRLGK